ncbi:hypothetical protein H9P43_004282 [Blastocladiella emersonii ATCC 22665]|nr:hypothetical protein H9P43_004282 [Blastocladiella emersonii ATCC 22665]
MTTTAEPKLEQKGRYLRHKVTNRTKLPLILAADYHESGRWWSVPPAAIPAGAAAEYTTCNRDGGVLTGTTGAVAYRLGTTEFYVGLFFSNPYLGGFKSGGRVYRGGAPSIAQLKADYASNDVVLTKAGTTQFNNVFVHHRPATAKDTPVEFVIEITGDALSGVPLDSLAVDAPSPLSPSARASRLATPRAIDPPYSIRLLSYNMFLRPLMVVDAATFMSNDYKETRTDMFCAAEFEHYDVMCLQEVYDPSLRDSLKSAARRWDFHYCAEGPTSGVALNSGILILSRFPILEPHVQAFHHGTGLDQLSAKGFVTCKLLMPRGGTLNLVVAHLQANGPSGAINAPLTSEWAATRYSQLLELAGTLRNRSHLVDAGLLLVGDLNVVGGTPEYGRMMHLLSAVTGVATATDLLEAAGMKVGTWRPWSAVAKPSNAVDETLARAATLTRSPSEEERVAAENGVCLDYMIYLKSGPTDPEAPPVFHLEVNKFAVDDSEAAFTQLSDHDGLCLYMA